MSGDLDYPVRHMDLILSFAKHELERYDLTNPAQFDAVNEAVMHHVADIVTWLAREAKAQRAKQESFRELVIDACEALANTARRAEGHRETVDATAQPCKHGEIHPYVPVGYERPVSGIYQCGACDEVIVEVKCRGCDVEMLAHQMAAHLAERCWAS